MECANTEASREGVEKSITEEKYEINGEFNHQLL